MLAKALHAGLYYANEALAKHDAELGRSTHKTETKALLIVADIKLIKRVIREMERAPTVTSDN
jgi:hypothetical protein